MVHVCVWDPDIISNSKKWCFKTNPDLMKIVFIFLLKANLLWLSILVVCLVLLWRFSFLPYFVSDVSPVVYFVLLFLSLFSVHWVWVFLSPAFSSLSLLVSLEHFIYIIWSISSICYLGFFVSLSVLFDSVCAALAFVSAYFGFLVQPFSSLFGFSHESFKLCAVSTWGLFLTEPEQNSQNTVSIPTCNEQV